jgi:hypothetical protein
MTKHLGFIVSILEIVLRKNVDDNTLLISFSKTTVVALLIYATCSKKSETVFEVF